ncbi:MAG: class I SAM-dependent methyltransferase [Candidatus Buchananbacteria bacterium]|nr:class I SAM-dependent methyltransferase [Candidatus Buchananbacteria bacterium]
MLDKKFWKKYFTVYDVLNIVIPYKELMSTICDKADVKKGDLILDAGSGTGNLSLELVHRGATVYATDFIKEGLDIYKEKNQNAIAIQHDLTERLPFPDDFFDKIVSNNVLYSVSKKDRRFVISELYRVLKPGGKIVISNIKSGWSPYRIYLSHLVKEYNNSGPFILLVRIVRFIFPTMMMFLYNAKIKRDSGAGGGYNFFESGEQRNLLINGNFRRVSEDVEVYADQAILNTGFKI